MKVPFSLVMLGLLLKRGPERGSNSLKVTQHVRSSTGCDPRSADPSTHSLIAVPSIAHLQQAPLPNTYTVPALHLLQEKEVKSVQAPGSLRLTPFSPPF